MILPTYNRSETIGRAIQSVLSQTYNNLELIIIDDGSTDNTSEIISRQFDKKNIRYYWQENKGASAARNYGLKLAQGKYIAFQDSDDEWLSNKLDSQVDIMELCDENTAVCYSNMNRIDELGQKYIWQSPVVFRGVVISELSLDYQVFGIGMQTSLVRKKCIDNIGMFDETLPRFIDLDWFTRLAEQYDFCFIQKPLVNYYETVGITSNLKSLIKAREVLLEKHANIFDENKLFYLAQQVRIAEAYWKDGQTKVARSIAFNAITLTPFKLLFVVKLVVIIFFPSSLISRLPLEIRKLFQ